MKKFLVLVELSKIGRGKTLKAVTVEAGNKKIAAVRALKLLNESEGTDVYKTIKKIDEVG